MKTRTSKAIGAAAGITAIALSVPFAVTAYAEPPVPEQPAEPTSTATVEIPQPPRVGLRRVQGSGAELEVAERAARRPGAAEHPPDASTFYSAISGGFNPPR